MDLTTINLILNAVMILISGGALGIWLRHRREMPKATAAANKLTSDAALVKSEAHDRDWERFHQEIARLEIRVEKTEKRASDCEERESELRKRLATAEDEIRGLQRQIANYSAETMLELKRVGCPATKAPFATAAAERVKNITGDGK
jgi:chromosome condensin MukBEF ATPase and DNA-binding subunit MukB